MSVLRYDEKPKQMVERKRYTYDEWLKVDFGDERAELIDGVIYMMAYANRRHQEIVTKMSGEMYNFLKGKPCRVYAGILAKLEASKHTEVVPDIAVVCDPKKLDSRGCKGAPDFVAEVLSPSTSKKDRSIKLNAYREAGVKEYWIVDPDDNTVTAYHLKDGEYTVRTYFEDDKAPIRTLPDFEFDLAIVFADEEN